MSDNFASLQAVKYIEENLGIRTDKLGKVDLFFCSNLLEIEIS